MSYGVCLPQKIMAQNIDTLNRVAIHGSVDMENGTCVQLLTKSATAGEGEVWAATQPSSTTGLQNLWMVYSPELVWTALGSGYVRGLDPDPRNFINKATHTFDCFKPQVGDIITLTDDAITGSKASNGYVVATASDYQLNWAGAAVSGLSLKLLATTYINIPAGTVGDTQRVTSYQFEVVAIA